METILDIQNLNKHFGGIKVAENLNLSLLKSSITGISGDNGVGKTTLFNMISGFEKSDSGSIHFKGQNISNKSVIQRAQLGMGRLFQTPRIFSEVTVLDNLMASSKYTTGHSLFKYLFKKRIIDDEERANIEKATEILNYFSLLEKSRLKAYELSVGEKKLLSLGSLLMNGANFILLDELTSGINYKMKDRLNAILSGLHSFLNFSYIDGFPTILMIEHDLDILNDICKQNYKLEDGKLYSL